MQVRAYRNAQANSDKQNAKLEHDRALNRVVLELLSDHTELFKQFSDNLNFKRWLTDMVFDATYQPRDANEARHGGITRERSRRVIEEKFGFAGIWSRGIDAIFDHLEQGRNKLGLSDLAEIEQSSGLSVSNILFPILNVLSTNDVGILRREFLNDARLELDFDAVSHLASTHQGENDWAERLSIRWTVQDVRGNMHG